MSFPNLYQTEIAHNNNIVLTDNNIIAQMEIDSVEYSRRQIVNTFLDKVTQKRLLPERIKENLVLLGMRKVYENTKKTAQQYRTGKLWLQYMEMISILKQFIQAEREGDWKGHLKAFQKCSLISQLRDNLYLKSSNVYLQEMSKLEESHPAVYKSLRLQYMEMISILKQFIQAEREGDWKGPLKTVSKMLSYFAAAGQLVPESLAMFICKKCLDWKKVTLQFTQHSWMETSL